MATLGYDPHLTLWLILHGAFLDGENMAKRSLSKGQWKEVSDLVDLITYGNPDLPTWLAIFKKAQKEKIGTSHLKKKEALLVQGLIECLNSYGSPELWTNPENIRLGVYDHFKGGVYKVRGFSSWESGERELVVEYDSLIFGTPHSRFAWQWCEVVQWPDGKYRSRWVHRGADLHTPAPSFKVPSPR